MTSLPADALVFKIPNGLYRLMLFCSACSLGYVGFVLALPVIDPSHLSVSVWAVLIVVSGTFATLCLRSFGRLRDGIAVSSKGVWFLPRKGQSTFMAWSEVKIVRADDTMQRLVLLDATGNRSIRLEYQLDGFAQLREFVLLHATAARPGTPSNIFHRTWINKCIVLGGAVFCLLIARECIHQGQPQSSLFFFGFAGLIGVMLTRDPTRVAITSDAVVIKYPGWERTIPFATVSGIKLTDIRDGKGNVWAAVVIERLQGKPLKLFRFREGSLALRDALNSAWTLAGGREKSDVVP